LSQKTRPYSIGMDKIAKILVAYYVYNMRQIDIANELKVGRTTVSYHTRKYRKVMAKIIDSCREEFGDNKIAFVKCVEKKAKNVLILNYGRKPKKRMSVKGVVE